jgi:hypothetical protein
VRFEYGDMRYFYAVILVRKRGIIHIILKLKFSVYLDRTIEIKGPVTKENLQKAIDKLFKDSPKKNLRKHFGQLKRNIDSLDYQKKVRDEWV